jgi:tetratricopeptide (TPR) repeat protein
VRAAISILVLLALVTPGERAARHVARGDLDAAEREYRALLESEPADVRWIYNLGTVLLMQQRFDEARPYLSVAADRGGAADAAYNLGNSNLLPAFADPDLPDRTVLLRRSIEGYKRALLATPGDVDAKWNLELARRLLEEEEEETPPPAGGGGGGGGGADGPPATGDPQTLPSPAGGRGPQPQALPDPAEELLRAAQEQELQVQRDRLAKPQPPGPIRP